MFPSTTALTRFACCEWNPSPVASMCCWNRGLDYRKQGVVELQVDLVVAGRDDCSVQGDVRGGGGVDVLTLPRSGAKLE